MAFLTMFIQVFILLLLMAVGYLAGKIRIISDIGAKEMTNLLVYIVSPCVIIVSFQMKYTPQLAKGLMIALASSVGIHVFSILVTKLVFNKRLALNNERKSALSFASVYSNSGFVGLPLLEAAAGTQGIFFGSVYIAVFNFFAWTHGISLYTGKKNQGSMKKLLLNPNLIAILIGSLLFFFSINIPGPVFSGMKYIYNLNTPLSMVVIGSRIARFDLRTMFSDRWIWPGILMRNLAMPFALLFVLHLAGVRGILLLSCIIPVACPVAGNTVLFAEITGMDTEFPSKLMFVSTLCSVITIPLIVSCAAL